MSNISINCLIESFKKNEELYPSEKEKDGCKKMITLLEKLSLNSETNETNETNEILDKMKEAMWHYFSTNLRWGKNSDGEYEFDLFCIPKHLFDPEERKKLTKEIMDYGSEFKQQLRENARKWLK